MGQDHPHKTKGTKNKQNIFSRDPRLVEDMIFIPELFEGASNQEIKNVQKIISQFDQHPIFTEIIDGINERFMNKSIDAIENNNTVKNVIINKFYQLHSIERFQELLLKIQKWYYVQKELKEVFNENTKNKTRKLTIRKKIQPNYTTLINIDLISKLFLHYYVIVLKKNYSSKETKRKKLLQDFHNKIGTMLCKMIQYKNLSEEKVTELLYKLVCVEKIDNFEKMNTTMKQIEKQFWPIYLTKEHEIGIDEAQHKRIKQFVRCYLSELYLRSIKQAEDPDINDQNQALGAIKSFPITRVKQKERLK